jgi:uncharacterized oligopeptide transporter (OPT) family protein
VNNISRMYLQMLVFQNDFLALFFGIAFSMLFAATNTYLGLKVGMTVLASIPGAVC